MQKKSSLSLLILLFLVATFAWADKAPQKQTYATFTSLYTAAKSKLVPKSKGGTVGQTILNVADLKDYLQLYGAYMHDAQGDLKNKQLWLDGKVPTNIFKTTKGTMCNYYCDAYEPFVEKRLLPAGSRVAVHGDLHGGFFELLEFIQHHIARGDIDDTFKIISPNFYLLFLGDYTDRGIFGAEVIYILLRLKLANPDRIFLVRGNHEETRCTQKYGFLDECVAKFKADGCELYNAIHYTYESFPVALYLGSGNGVKNYYFQTCHGGMEIGFDSRPLLADKRSHVRVLLNKLNREHGFKKLSLGMQSQLDSSLFKNVELSDFGERLYCDIGFMWNDFIVDSISVHSYSRGRGHKYGKSLTQEVLSNGSAVKDNYEVVGVLRAHQHGDPEMMNSIKNGKGISRLWSTHTSDLARGLWRGIVCTFTVAPDAGYGKRFGMDFDAFGLLQLGDTFEKCSLDVFQIFEHKLYAK